MLALSGVWGCASTETPAFRGIDPNGVGGGVLAGSGEMAQAGSGGGGDHKFDNGSGGLLDAGKAMGADAGMLPVDGKCGASSFEAKQIVMQKEVQVTTEVKVTKPVVLYVLFDQSLSMSWSNIWDPAVTAMKSFLSNEKSQGIGVGLQFFPISGGSCATGSGYSAPAVPVGKLPAQYMALSASLDAHDPNGTGTPIEGALRGVTEFCKKYQTDHKDEQCVAVLVTDGKPEFASGCTEDDIKLAAIGKAAHTAGVTTFTVGLKGADFGLLDKIALESGAPDCEPNNATRYACDVSSGADKLADALNSIRDTVVKTEVHTEIETHVEETKLPCEWQIPTPPAGQMFDRDKVNIRLSAGTTVTNFFRVPNAEGCRANGWRFDNPEAPARLVACPQTCEQIKATPEAKIDVLLGCATLGPQ